MHIISSDINKCKAQKPFQNSTSFYILLIWPYPSWAVISFTWFIPLPSFDPILYSHKGFKIYHKMVLIIRKAFINKDVFVINALRTYISNVILAWILNMFETFVISYALLFIRFTFRNCRDFLLARNNG